jgi:acid stress-induced BolA-like protein IbaG/YrbA
MLAENIKQLIESNLFNSTATVIGDSTHFEAIVVSPEFEGQKTLDRHRKVYATLGNSFESDIHAFTLKTYTPAEWEKLSK